MQRWRAPLRAEEGKNPRIAAFLAAARAQRPSLPRRRFSERPLIAAIHADVLERFAAERDRDRLHRLGMDMLRLWDEPPEPALEPAMPGAIYERGPCSCCRESAVRRMIKAGLLAPEMAAECAWDANPDIRLVTGPAT